MIYAMTQTGKAGKNLTPQAVFHYTAFHIFLFKSAQLSFDSYGYLLLRLDVEAVFRPHPRFPGLRKIKAFCRSREKEFVVMR